MTCPLCGDDCTCSFVSDDASDARVAVLIDPEQDEHTEERFAQSLEGCPPDAPQSVTVSAEAPPPDAGRWRDEVASRLHNYRVRRQRYVPGSLSLDFDGSAQREPEPEPPPPPRQAAPEAPKIIEFPRPAPMPEMEELAEPMSAITAPRILEAEEPMLPFEQTMSITLDAAPPSAAAEPQPGVELPLPVASVGTRAWAAASDLAALAFALAAFALVASRWMVVLPPVTIAALVLGGLAAVLWGVYQYVFLVYAGFTPGQQAMGLSVLTFDGEEAGRARRRWRALAMLVSCMSLGLGFAWAFFDEDTLCWHDRITRTYLAQR